METVVQLPEVQIHLHRHGTVLFAIATVPTPAGDLKLTAEYDLRQAGPLLARLEERWARLREAMTASGAAPPAPAEHQAMRARIARVAIPLAKKHLVRKLHHQVKKITRDPELAKAFSLPTLPVPESPKYRKLILQAIALLRHLRRGHPHAHKAFAAIFRQAHAGHPKARRMLHFIECQHQREALLSRVHGEHAARREGPLPGGPGRFGQAFGYPGYSDRDPLYAFRIAGHPSHPRSPFHPSSQPVTVPATVAGAHFGPTYGGGGGYGGIAFSGYARPRAPAQRGHYSHGYLAGHPMPGFHPGWRPEAPWGRPEAPPWHSFAPPRPPAPPPHGFDGGRPEAPPPHGFDVPPAPPPSWEEGTAAGHWAHHDPYHRHHRHHRHHHHHAAGDAVGDAGAGTGLSIPLLAQMLPAYPPAQAAPWLAQLGLGAPQIGQLLGALPPPYAGQLVQVFGPGALPAVMGILSQLPPTQSAPVLSQLPPQLIPGALQQIAPQLSPAALGNLLLAVPAQLRGPIGQVIPGTTLSGALHATQKPSAQAHPAAHAAAATQHAAAAPAHAATANLHAAKAQTAAPHLAPIHAAAAQAHGLSAQASSLTAQAHGTSQQAAPFRIDPRTLRMLPTGGQAPVVIKTAVVPAHQAQAAQAHAEAAQAQQGAAALHLALAQHPNLAALHAPLAHAAQLKANEHITLARAHGAAAQSPAAVHLPYHGTLPFHPPAAPEHVAPFHAAAPPAHPAAPWAPPGHPGAPPALRAHPGAPYAHPGAPLAHGGPAAPPFRPGAPFGHPGEHHPAAPWARPAGPREHHPAAPWARPRGPLEPRPGAPWGEHRPAAPWGDEHRPGAPWAERHIPEPWRVWGHGDRWRPDAPRWERGWRPEAPGWRGGRPEAPPPEWRPGAPPPLPGGGGGFDLGGLFSHLLDPAGLFRHGGPSLPGLPAPGFDLRPPAPPAFADPFSHAWHHRRHHPHHRPWRPGAPPPLEVDEYAPPAPPPLDFGPPPDDGGGMPDLDPQTFVEPPDEGGDPSISYTDGPAPDVEPADDATASGYYRPWHRRHHGWPHEAWGWNEQPSWPGEPEVFAGHRGGGGGRGGGHRGGFGRRGFWGGGGGFWGGGGGGATPEVDAEFEEDAYVSEGDVLAGFDVAGAAARTQRPLTHARGAKKARLPFRRYHPAVVKFLDRWLPGYRVELEHGIVRPHAPPPKARPPLHPAHPPAPPHRPLAPPARPGAPPPSIAGDDPGAAWQMSVPGAAYQRGPSGLGPWGASHPAQDPSWNARFLGALPPALASTMAPYMSAGWGTW